MQLVIRFMLYIYTQLDMCYTLPHKNSTGLCLKISRVPVGGPSLPNAALMPPICRLTHNEQVVGGVLPGIRGFNDWTHVAMQNENVNHWVPKSGWKINCSRYVGGPLVFFKGHEHRSWLPPAFFQDRSNSSGYERRIKYPRARMDQLEGSTARAQGIQVYMKPDSNPGDYSEAGKAIDYATMMGTSRFCFAPVGLQPAQNGWTHSFFISCV